MQVTTPEAGTVRYEYDAADHVVARVSADGTQTSYAYDGFGRLTQTSYGVSPATGQQDAPITYHYGEGYLQVLECKTNSPFQVNADARYGLGRLTSVEDHAGKRYFAYDVQGHQTVVAELRAGESCARLTRTSYDGAGRVLQLEYPTGRLLAYLYQGADPTVPSTIRTWVGAEQIDLVSNVRSVGGRVVGWHSWNGVENQSGAFLTRQPRLTRAKIDGTDLSHREVTSLDPMGNPQRILGETAGTTEDFGYEGHFSTLATAQTEDSQSAAPYRTLGYTVALGNEGNRLQTVSLVPDAGVNLCQAQASFNLRTSTYTYAPASSQLQVVQAVETDPNGLIMHQLRSVLGYTASGATASWSKYDDDPCTPVGGEDCHLRSTVVSGYDQEDELVSWTEDGQVNRYGYDERHLRTQKQDATGTLTEFWYDDSGMLHSEGVCVTTSCASMSTRDYVSIGGVLVAILDGTAATGGSLDDRGTRIYSVHSGLLNEPRAVTDESANVVWTAEREPFGTVNSSHQSSLTLNVGLPGQYGDSESGMIYNWHRYYSSELGRYWSGDPLRSSGRTLPAYSYAYHNPIVFFDQSGLDAARFSSCIDGCRSYMSGVNLAMLAICGGYVVAKNVSAPPICVKIAWVSLASCVALCVNNEAAEKVCESDAAKSLGNLASEAIAKIYSILAFDPSWR
jgi:RHS repeat-associated protein